MGNENNHPQTYRWRINTPVLRAPGCQQLALEREIPHLNSETCPALQSDPLVRSPCSSFASMALPAWLFLFLSFKMHKMLLYISGLSKNPLKSQKITVQKQEGCKPCRCFWDVIEGHHPPWSGLSSCFLAFLHHSCRVKSYFQVKRCATTRPEATTSLSRLPLGPEVLPNHDSGGVFQRTYELTHAPPPSSRSAEALYEDKLWECFPRKNQMVVIFNRAFHRCLQDPSPVGSNPSSSSLLQAGLCMEL